MSEHGGAGQHGRNARGGVGVSGIGEFGLIGKITARLSYGPTTLLGPGDDAAVVAAPDGRVVASTDVLVEGRHFRRDWSSARDVGHRAAAANLADIAAMGATPTALLVALCMPADLDTAWAEELADGLAAEAATVGASVVGGDMSASPTLTVAVTALGDLEGRPPVLRSGARPGDVLALAGRIGYAAAGLTVLSRGFRTPRLLVEAYRRPEVPYQAGPQAARLGATSMIDVSDGLLADLGHVVGGQRGGDRRAPRRVRGAPADGRRGAGARRRPVHLDPRRWRRPRAGRDLPPGGGAAAGLAADRPGHRGCRRDGRRRAYDGPAGWDHFR